MVWVLYSIFPSNCLVSALFILLGASMVYYSIQILEDYTIYVFLICALPGNDSSVCYKPYCIPTFSI
ncbi:unnamed protein product [Linum trigynum]|uniref:Uncharacterized protein n=1 Tax=Linum trigynum TaxID=586398 RepID=A0AAV2FNP6_9ROSI